jgi:hypothetical protein
MGHKLSTALILLNAMGILACVILIAAANSHAPEVAIWFIRAIQPSIRMFIVGVGLPLVAWEIAESEFYRSNEKLRLLESWTIFFLIIVSWTLFFVAAWRLPSLIVEGLKVPALF